jgi:5-methyltetrahydropteroyltriglutamate--homocysteine methyltransferase
VSEALTVSRDVKPVLIGPNHVFVAREKPKQLSLTGLELLPALLTAYQRVLSRLREMGIQWVQLDEPALVDRTRQ